MDYLILSLSGLLGIVGHLLMKYRDAYTNKVDMIWKEHIINAVFAVFVIIVLLYFGNEIEVFYPLTKLTIFIAGYAADSLWKNFTNRSLTSLGI